MKILFLIWSYWPGLQGGSERQARLISHAVARRGCSCEVVTARLHWIWPRVDDDQGVRVRRIGIWIPLLIGIRNATERILRAMAGHIWKRPGSAPRFLEDLVFWMAAPWTWAARLDFIVEFLVLCRTHRLRADLVHLHEPSWLGGVAQLAAGRAGFKVLCQEATSPALPTIGYDTPFRAALDRQRKRAHYVAMAKYTAEQLAEAGIPRPRIHDLPSGVRVPPNTTRGIGSFHVLYVANFSQGAAWKAFDVLFAAWIQIARREPRARLYAVGGGDASPWKAMLAAAGVADTAVFAGTVKDIEEYFGQAAIFVLPSRVEGLSNALLEAQMWGLACVVSDIPGNTAVVEPGVNGMVVPVGDAPSLAAAVVQLLRNADLQARLGLAAREKAMKEYGIDSVAERLLHIYGEILSVGAGFPVSGAGRSP